MSESAKQRPVREVTYWPLRVAIWRNTYEDNEGQTRVMCSCVLTRQYREKKEGQYVWKSTHSLNLEDTLVAAKLLSDAHTVIHQLMAADREEQRDEQDAA
jgi:hypothetical protein